MDPEINLYVRLLRFLNFEAAANRVVNSLQEGKQLTLNPVIESAIGLIHKKIDTFKKQNAQGFYPSQDVQQTILETIAVQLNLDQLEESQIIQEHPVATPTM